RARVRGTLVATARALIAENGVAGLRVSDITERADVAFGTFYTHFDTKDDVIEAIVAESVQGLAERIAGMAATFEDPAEQASAALRSFIRLAYDDPEIASLLLNLTKAEARFEMMVWPHAGSVIERGIATGRFTVADSATALMMSVGSTLAILTGVLEGHLGQDADVFFSEMMLLVLGLDRTEAAEIAARELPRIQARPPEADT
ncbi:MAG: putative TetR family transcriptional regulator, partial [Solirubrobacterales bacterium]|nr:putative TetR family transcriptional regulator [Solirubrobacterales bacterium]